MTVKTVNLAFTCGNRAYNVRVHLDVPEALIVDLAKAEVIRRLQQRVRLGKFNGETEVKLSAVMYPQLAEVLSMLSEAETKALLRAKAQKAQDDETAQAPTPDDADDVETALDVETAQAE